MPCSYHRPPSSCLYSGRYSDERGYWWRFRTPRLHEPSCHMPWHHIQHASTVACGHRVPMHLHVFRFFRMYGMQLYASNTLPVHVSSVSLYTRLHTHAHRAQSVPLHVGFTQSGHPCLRHPKPSPDPDIQRSDPIRPATRPHTTYAPCGLTCTHAQHTRQHTHTHAHEHKQTHTPTHRHAHTQTHTRTPKYRHTHAHPYTPTKNDLL